MRTQIIVLLRRSCNRPDSNPRAIAWVPHPSRVFCGKGGRPRTPTRPVVEFSCHAQRTRPLPEVRRLPLPHPSSATTPPEKKVKCRSSRNGQRENGRCQQELRANSYASHPSQNTRRMRHPNFIDRKRVGRVPHPSRAFCGKGGRPRNHPATERASS